MAFAFSNEAIDELQRIIEDEFREPVTTEDARVAAHNLLELYQLLSDCAARMSDEQRSRSGLSDRSG